MAGRLQDKIVVLTGANSGVGEETAKLFAAEGATVVLTARRVAELERVAGEIAAKGGKVFYQSSDVKEEASVKALFDEVIARYGRVDVLVNNAGVLDEVRALLKTSDEMFHKVIDINTLGTFHCMREALKHMTAAGKGSIINVASVAGKYGAGGAAYAASKGGMIALTKSVAIRYGTSGVRCNVICPGSIITPMSAPENIGDIDMEMAQAIMSHQCADVQPSYPEDQAKVLLFLASDDSAAINGQAITTDKGASL